VAGKSECGLLAKIETLLVDARAGGWTRRVNRLGDQSVATLGVVGDSRVRPAWQLKSACPLRPGRLKSSRRMRSCILSCSGLGKRQGPIGIANCPL
jgi:hypothetical protein